jgi:uncharacterized protein involved in exopolysaccharide biosynthesis
VVAILLHRKWLFTLPVLTGILGTLAVSLCLPREYYMRTVVERRDDPVALRLVANSPYSFEAMRKSLRFNLIGLAAVDKALGQIDPRISGLADEGPGPARQALAAAVAPKLNVTLLDTNPNYDLIELKYTGDQPHLGEKLVTTLRDNYIAQTQDTMRNMQEQAQRFFAAEVEKRSTRVARSQAELSQVLMNQPELDPGRPDWLNEKLVAESLALEQLNRQKAEFEAEILARDDYLKQLDVQQKQGKLPSRTVFATKAVDSPQRTRLEQQMTEIMAELADAKTIRHMKDTHPYVEGLNRKLKQLHVEFERLPREIAGGPVETEPQASPWDSERSRIGMELKTYRGKLEQVEKDLARHQVDKTQLEGQKSTVFDRQQAFMLRRQEVENAKADLAVWQSRLEELNRSLAAEHVDRGSRFNTIEECRRPTRPITPKLSSTLLLSLGVGLSIGIVIVFLRELFDRSLRNPARVRNLLGIPVLETIGEIVVRSSPRIWMERYCLPAVAAMQVLMILALGSLVYASLESPDTYARWMGSITARWSEIRTCLT